MQQEKFLLPSSGQPFVSGDVSTLPGFELEQNESLDSLARRWYSSAELYLSLFLAIPVAERPRFC
eukprot:4594749-Pyramimonas_sp.AAC.1